MLVFFKPPNNGETGSRTWKSIGPFFICKITLSSNFPSNSTKLSYAALARSVFLSRQSCPQLYTKQRHTKIPPYGASALPNIFAPSACVLPYVNGPGLPSESAFTKNPPKFGITSYTCATAFFHQSATIEFNGSQSVKLSNSIGAAKFTLVYNLIPYFANKSAYCFTCCK